jgi:hypothetical protein
MSYKSATFTRTGNGKMAAAIKNSAKTHHLTISRFTSAGWVLKQISITVYGHVDDIAAFEKNLPEGVNH